MGDFEIIRIGKYIEIMVAIREGRRVLLEIKTPKGLPVVVDRVRVEDMTGPGSEDDPMFAEPEPEPWG